MVWEECWILHTGIWWNCVKNQKPACAVQEQFSVSVRTAGHQGLCGLCAKSYLYSFIESKVYKADVLKNQKFKHRRISNQKMHTRSVNEI